MMIRNYFLLGHDEPKIYSLLLSDTNDVKNNKQLRSKFANIFYFEADIR